MDTHTPLPLPREAKVPTLPPSNPTPILNKNKKVNVQRKRSITCRRASESALRIALPYLQESSSYPTLHDPSRRKSKCDLRQKTLLATGESPKLFLQALPAKLPLHLTYRSPPLFAGGVWLTYNSWDKTQHTWLSKRIYLRAPQRTLWTSLFSKRSLQKKWLALSASTHTKQSSAKNYFVLVSTAASHPPSCCRP